MVERWSFKYDTVKFDFRKKVTFFYTWLKVKMSLIFEPRRIFIKKWALLDAWHGSECLHNKKAAKVSMNYVGFVYFSCWCKMVRSGSKIRCWVSDFFICPLKMCFSVPMKFCASICVWLCACVGIIVCGYLYYVIVCVFWECVYINVGVISNRYRVMLLFWYFVYRSDIHTCGVESLHMGNLTNSWI